MLYKIKNLFLIATIGIISSCGTNKGVDADFSEAKKSSDLPTWINDYKDNYPEMLYISSLGVSKYKNVAEKQAVRGISNTFEVHIQSSEISSEITKESEDDFSQTYNSISNINTTSNQKLVNIKISETYHDAKNNNYYVLATLNKSETAAIYMDEKTKLLAESESILAKYRQEKNSLSQIALLSNAIAKLQKVEEIDKKLSILDNTATNTKSFESVSNLMVEREKILDKVPVFIANDDDKIYAMLKREFTSLGFKITDEQDAAIISTDYSLDIKNSDIKNETAKFAMWNLSIDLNNKKKKRNFGTYISKGRASQLTYDAARERAYFDIDRKIKGDFKAFLISKILKVE